MWGTLVPPRTRAEPPGWGVCCVLGAQDRAAMGSTMGSIALWARDQVTTKGTEML